MVAFTSILSLLAASSVVLASIELPSHGRSAVAQHSRRRHHAKRALAKRCDSHPTSSAAGSKSTGKPRASSTHAASPTASSKPQDDPEDGGDDGESPVENSLKAVFPTNLEGAVNTWSTIPSVKGSVALSDASLNIYRGKTTHHTFTKDVSGLSRNTESVLRAFYQKGSTSPGHSGKLVPGFSLYSKTTTDLSKGNEVLFSYKAYFPPDYDFVHGGKMPGLYGGTDDKVATTASGGRHDARSFSVRMMWRENGEGELYSYLPQTDSNTKAYQKATKKVHVNGQYGISVARGSFSWKKGAWTEITQRIKLNDVGKNNGELQIWVNGKSVLEVPGLMYRTSAQAKVRGAQIETFFGGHDKYWATPKDQYSYFKDFSTAVLN